MLWCSIVDCWWWRRLLFLFLGGGKAFTFFGVILVIMGSNPSNFCSRLYEKNNFRIRATGAEFQFGRSGQSDPSYDKRRITRETGATIRPKGEYPILHPLSIHITVNSTQPSIYKPD